MGSFKLVNFMVKACGEIRMLITMVPFSKAFFMDSAYYNNTPSLIIVAILETEGVMERAHYARQRARNFIQAILMKEKCTVEANLSPRIEYT